MKSEKLKFLLLLILLPFIIFSFLLSPILIIVDILINFKRKDKTVYFNEKFNLFQNIKEIKRYKNSSSKSNNPFFLVIATSAGEISTIETLFEEIKINLFILTTSITGRYKNTVLHNCTVRYMPFPFSLFSFFTILSLKPQAIIFLEHEFWPSYFIYSFLLNIPILALQIRPSLFKDIISSKFYTYLLKLSRKIFLTEEKSKYPLDFPFDKVKVDNLDIKTTKKLTVYDEKKKIAITFASTHEQEEQIFFESINELTKISNLTFIFVPRHPDRSTKIKENAKEHGIDSIFFSQIEDEFETYLKKLNEQKEKFKIIIVDKFGLLDLIYSYSKVSIVGGTFAELGGGHNVYEPLLKCSTVIAGPFLHNMLNIFNEAVKLKIALFSLGNKEDLKNKIINLSEISISLQNKKGTIDFNGSPFQKIYLSQYKAKQHILDEILQASRNS